MEPKQGFIAILDALGAANYSHEQIDQFLRSRELVIEQLMDKAAKLKIDQNSIITFTFNDTVLIVYVTDAPATLKHVQHFGELLRRFTVKSLANGILFRGAIAIGQFHCINKDTNTIMGNAVSDAAAWYDCADWIGIAATPKATMLIQSLTEQGNGDIERLMVDYPVPLKDQRTLSLKAVNWPKAFTVKGMTPCAPGEAPKAKCLSLLTKHNVPKRTESKYSNTVAFFDYCEDLRRRKK